MSTSFSADFPAWLVQPAVLANIMENQFASLQNIPTAVSVPDLPIFMTGLKQALFWRRRLAPTATKHTVIFSFLGIRGLTLPNVLEVCQALKSICNMTQLVEVYRAPNSPFIGISFSNSTSTHIFQTLCHSFKDFFVFIVSPSSTHTHNFKLLGLPPLFHDSHIHHFLSKHSLQHNFIQDRIITDANITTPLNSVSGSIQLSPSQDISLIPHLIPLPPPHLGSALFIISGRPPLCLKCGVTGHIRRFCTSTKCTSCHRFHLSSLSCSSASSLLDSSLISSWDINDTSSTHHSSDSPPVTSILPECESSSPPPPSSPSITKTYASIISSSSILPATTNLDTNSLLIPHNNITVPSHSSAAIITDSSLLISTNIAHNTSQPSNNVSSHIFADNSMPSVLDSHSSLLPLKQSSPLPLPPAIPDVNSAFLDAKRTKKASLSSKRFRATSSNSSSSSPKHNPSSHNLFLVLQDEVHSIPGAHLITSSSVSLNTSTSSNQIETTAVPTATVFSAQAPIHHPSSTLSSSNAHKKAKISSTSSSAIVPTTSSISDFTPIAPASCWGDRMEMELDTTISSAPPLQLDPSYPQPPVILPTSNTSMNPHTPSPQDNILLDHELSESDTSSSNHSIQLQLHGFPSNTDQELIEEFLGFPKPKNILRELDEEGSFTGRHFATYSSMKDARCALERDGQWFDSHIISVSIKPTISSSEESS